MISDTDTDWILQEYTDGLVQDCSISIGNALEILQSCTQTSIFHALNGKTIHYLNE